MDIVNLLISLVSGIIGGNAAGAATPDKNLGALGNTIAGLLGGGAGGYILNALDLFKHAGVQAADAGIDIPALLANIGASGVGGALLTVIVSLVKNALDKR